MAAPQKQSRALNFQDRLMARKVGNTSDRSHDWVADLTDYRSGALHQAARFAELGSSHKDRGTEKRFA